MEKIKILYWADFKKSYSRHLIKKLQEINPMVEVTILNHIVDILSPEVDVFDYSILLIQVTDVSKFSASEEERTRIGELIEEYVDEGNKLIVSHDVVYRRTRNEILQEMYHYKINNFARENNVKYTKTSYCKQVEAFSSLPSVFTLNDGELCWGDITQLQDKKIFFDTVVVDPQTGQPRRYFDATDETYEALSTDDPDSLKIQDNSVELRVEEHIAAINAFLNIFCLQIGLSAGTFSFDVRNHGIKTATEVVSENSKTYKTVKNFQNMIRPAVIRLIKNIIAVASLYDMQTEDGESVSALAAKGYEVNIAMDDGITQDRQTNINEGITLVSAGLISKKTFLTDPKYGQGLTEETADQELQRIAEEQRVSSGVVDRLNLFTAE